MKSFDEEKFIHELLTDIFRMSGHNALVETVSRIAAELGVHKIDGYPVEEFYGRRKRKIAEEFVCDYADVNVAMALKVKAAWKKLDDDNDEAERKKRGLTRQ